MVPRVDIVGLSKDSAIDIIMDIIKEQQFSKIPIYKDSIDNIKGILYAKDIIPYLLGSRPKINLLSLSRETFFVPEQKKLDDLLLDFKEKRTNIAIVVDEWGGTSGLVTLEDVVEEVIGEIHDPFDKAESGILLADDGSLIVDASISIYDLEEQTDIIFPESEERDFDTLGGLILDLLGDIPQKNDSVEYQNRVYTVKTIESNRINKVHISSKVVKNEE
jgi:CBS domain containing-hemolysin-like protein